ncbi:hypothetical protein ACFYVL_09115 [Streptomyces sp. NPDC004111]|uniref:hypothetical protein n=1 Tax=Streptomyces sp. NPDC004111 TaxID=3364690 RepID=UPI0036BFCBCD
MTRRSARSSPPTPAEADAWATVLVRRRLLYAALTAPNGQWLVQYASDGPVLLLDGPADMVELAATIQHRLATRPPSR